MWPGLPCWSKKSGHGRGGGLSDITPRPKPQHIDAMVDWQDPLYRASSTPLPPGSKASDYITNLDVTAVKQ